MSVESTLSSCVSCLCTLSFFLVLVSFSLVLGLYRSFSLRSSLVLTCFSFNVAVDRYCSFSPVLTQYRFFSLDLARSRPFSLFLAHSRSLLLVLTVFALARWSPPLFLAMLLVVIGLREANGGDW